jgi:hypothetical protein
MRFRLARGSGRSVFTAVDHRLTGFRDVLAVGDADWPEQLVLFSLAFLGFDTQPADLALDFGQAARERRDRGVGFRVDGRFRFKRLDVAFGSRESARDARLGTPGVSG